MVASILSKGDNSIFLYCILSDNSMECAHRVFLVKNCSVIYYSYILFFQLTNILNILCISNWGKILIKTKVTVLITQIVWQLSENFRLSIVYIYFDFCKDQGLAGYSWIDNWHQINWLHLLEYVPSVLSCILSFHSLCISLMSILLFVLVSCCHFLFGIIRCL